jgi:glutathione S-transferase
VYLKRSLDQREGWRVERGEAALALMDKQLASRSWFVGEAMTIADIALLAYTRLAHEGGFDLTPRRNVRAWIGRCEDVLGLAPVHG